MNKGICLTGAHATGKSTIAREMADLLGLNFITSQASQVFEDYGIDPKETLPFETRLGVQSIILSRHSDAWDRANDSGAPFITDRSPIDFIVYLMNDSFVYEDEHYDQWMQFISDCLYEWKSSFQHTFLVTPDGQIDTRDVQLKGRPSRILQECMNTLYAGILENYPDSYTIVAGSREERRVLIYDKILQLIY